MKVGEYWKQKPERTIFGHHWQMLKLSYAQQKADHWICDKIMYTKGNGLHARANDVATSGKLIYEEYDKMDTAEAIKMIKKAMQNK